MTQKEKDIEYILDGLEKLGFDLNNDAEKAKSFIFDIISKQSLDISPGESDLTLG